MLATNNPKAKSLVAKIIPHRKEKEAA
jgi:hypothetical protein